MEFCLMIMSSKKVNKSVILTIRVPPETDKLIKQAAEMDGRDVPDFIRHYLKITSSAIVAVGIQRDILGAFGNKKVMSQFMKELKNLE